MKARRAGTFGTACLSLLLGCGAPPGPANASPSAMLEPRVVPRTMHAATADPPRRVKAEPEPEASCGPGQIAWRPQQCRFAECQDGRIAAASDDDDVFRDCLRPLQLVLQFPLQDSHLTVKQLAELENLAEKAGVLGVKQLTVTGQQSWDEAPDARAKTPLSRVRATVVRDALTVAAQLSVEVKDGGTRPRRDVTGEAQARSVTVSMAPLEASALPTASAPFTLPWTECESNVTVRTPITLTTRDGDVQVEICRNGKCSRGIVQSSYFAVWPGQGGSVMSGDFQAWLSMEPTPEQLVHNGEIEMGKGEGPASFFLTVSFQDPNIRDTDAFRFRLLRRRKEPALDWSGKLTFEHLKPHPTRPVPACLSGTLEIPQERHSLR